MNSKFYTLLMFAVKAGKVSFGHDAVKQSLRTRKASAVIIFSDASKRLKEEISGLASYVPIYFSDYTISDAAMIFGKKAAVLTVNDKGFALSLKNTVNTAENKEDKICR